MGQPLLMLQLIPSACENQHERAGDETLFGLLVVQLIGLAGRVAYAAGGDGLLRARIISFKADAGSPAPGEILMTAIPG